MTDNQTRKTVKKLLRNMVTHRNNDLDHKKQKGSIIFPNFCKSKKNMKQMWNSKPGVEICGKI